MLTITVLFTVLGLALFEIVSSLDNAVINAEVLSTVSQRARKWFLTWGLFFAVVVVRGLLPWVIVWVAMPGTGPIEALRATFSNTPEAHAAIETATPILLMGGGIFLVLLFLHWLFVEDKKYGLPHEPFFHRQSIWFYAIASVLLCAVVWFALHLENPIVAFGAVVGSTVFFLTSGFKSQAEETERKLLENNNAGLGDVSKIVYLEAIDTTFSIDGVLGAFAFTFSIPLILLGNSLGAVAIRQFTVSNIERIKRYQYIKNGAMYAIAALGTTMLLRGFGIHVPEWVAPVITVVSVGYFFWVSRREIKRGAI